MKILINGAASTCIIAKATTSPVLIGEFPINLSS